MIWTWSSVMRSVRAAWRRWWSDEADSHPCSSWWWGLWSCRRLNGIRWWLVTKCGSEWRCRVHDRGRWSSVFPVAPKEIVPDLWASGQRSSDQTFHSWRTNNPTLGGCQSPKHLWSEVPSLSTGCLLDASSISYCSFRLLQIRSDLRVFMVSNEHDWSWSFLSFDCGWSRSLLLMLSGLWSSGNYALIYSGNQFKVRADQ